MNFPTPDFFQNTAIEVFSDLVMKYNYHVIQDNCEPFYVRLLYLNDRARRKIEVINATNYTDYGFSFFLHNLDNNEFNVFYNVPFDLQDVECHFLKKAKEDLWGQKDVMSMLMGEKWIRQTKVFFQK